MTGECDPLASEARERVFAIGWQAPLLDRKSVHRPARLEDEPHSFVAERPAGRMRMAIARDANCSQVAGEPLGIEFMRRLAAALGAGKIFQMLSGGPVAMH